MALLRIILGCCFPALILNARIFEVHENFEEKKEKVALQSEQLVSSKIDDGLPAAWRDTFMQGGQFFIAAMLCTKFTHKYEGRHLDLGDSVDIRLKDEKTSSPTLLARAGKQEAVGFIWLGDKDAGDPTIYVSFTMIVRKRQIMKLLREGSVITLMPNPLNGTRTRFQIAAYTKRKVDKLWFEYEFRDKLKSVIETHPGRRIMFVGMSHGGVIAQAAALRWATEEVDEVNKLENIYLQTYGAYRWCDMACSETVDRIFAGRFLPIVLGKKSEKSRSGIIVDGVPSFPNRYAPMIRNVWLDVETGEMHPFPLELQQSTDVPSKGSPAFWMRMKELHMGVAVVKASLAAYNFATNANLPEHH